MMMCIGGLSDFEAQIDRSADRFMRGRSAEEAELVTRSWDWLYMRQHVDGSLNRAAPAAVEPPRPYSHGRRFIPAWLIADREFYMAASISCDYHGAEARHRLYGVVRVDVDTTVMVRRK